MKQKEILAEKYEYSDENFSLILPSRSTDFIKEAEEQDNCVAHYIDRVISGESLILFLRKNSELNRSFITVEIQGSKLIQFRGYRNSSNTDVDAALFIKKYAEERGLTIDCNILKKGISIPKNRYVA